MTSLSGFPVRSIAFLNGLESKSGSGSIASHPWSGQEFTAQVMVAIAFIFFQNFSMFP
jgi:hypothetical protein